MDFFICHIFYKRHVVEQDILGTQEKKNSYIFPSIFFSF